MQGKIKAMAILYRNFKQRIRLMKKYEKDYHVENLEGYLYMSKKEGA